MKATEDDTNASQKAVELEKEEDVEMSDVSESQNGDGDEDSEKKKPWYQKIKESGIKKAPKEVIKKRRNYRLKKLLTPKSPLMLLHELLPQENITYEFDSHSGSIMARNGPQLYAAKASHNGKNFVGHGPSKSIAKNQCAEKILQEIVTQTCENETEEEESAEEKKENTDDGEEKQGGQHRMETETPWVSLASLALFKMFNDWQAEGYAIPIDVGNNVAAGLKSVAEGEKPKKPTAAPKETPSPARAEKTLPDNPTSKHPVQLLNEMEGPLVYDETVTGEGQNGIFTLTVVVKGKTFTGQGKNKKDAKKKAAANALKGIHGVNYDV